MKKLLSLFAQFPTFAMMQEMEAKTKPKEHYLIERLKRLRNAHKLARKDQNLLKIRQAEYLIKKAEEVLSNNGKLLYAHIEQKEVIN